MATNPWKKAVNLAVANTIYNLNTLMLALDASAPTTCTELTLQIDPEWAGTYMRVGNSDVSFLMWGDKLVPGQGAQNQTRYNNCATRQIYLVADAANCVVGVSALQG